MRDFAKLVYSARALDARTTLLAPALQRVLKFRPSDLAKARKVILTVQANDNDLREALDTCDAFQSLLRLTMSAHEALETYEQPEVRGAEFFC